MFKRLLLLAALLVTAGIVAPVAEATSWVFIPTWRLVDMADVVVVGKVTKIEAAKPGGAAHNYEQAIVEVSDVLKGPAGMKEVRLRQFPPPPPDAPVLPGLPLRYPVGTQGVFLLKRDAKEALYGPPTHPSEFQATQQKDEIVKVVKARAAVGGGKPMAGLVARAEVETQKQGPSQIWFSFKNVSDKPIVIANYIASRPLHVDWFGPDNQKRDAKLYAWLDDPRIGPQAPLSERNFITLQPLGVCFLGPRGDTYSGIALPNPGPGDQRVTIRFTSKQDGARFGLKNVWTGTIESNEIVVK